jgi:hypothetical protein
MRELLILALLALALAGGVAFLGIEKPSPAKAGCAGCWSTSMAGCSGC